MCPNMKNFSDLLATDCTLTIRVVTPDGTRMLHWPLTRPLALEILAPWSVCVDDMEILSFGYWQNDKWLIHHEDPFYRWRHHVTGQGWLLSPAKAGG